VGGRVGADEVWGVGCPGTVYGSSTFWGVQEPGI